MILQIDENAEEIYFPDPHYGDDDGCFAIGGDLSIDRLLLAYSNGIFPWYSFRDQPEILWFCPMKRFVIFPDEIHISHSMRTLLRKNRYSVGINEDFDAVIRACSKTNGRYEEEGAWLGENIIQAFTALHEQGFAASVEVWDNETGELVGGLYGVTIGKVFIGESMFSKVPSGSKIALITRSKEDTTNSRRVVFRYLQNKEAIKELFGAISAKVADRPGGYTRIIKLGFRQGDAAQMCFIELVDFDENMAKTATKKKSTRRSRKSTKAEAAPAADTAVEEAPATEAPAAEEAPKAE